MYNGAEGKGREMEEEVKGCNLALRVKLLGGECDEVISLSLSHSPSSLPRRGYCLLCCGQYFYHFGATLAPQMFPQIIMT